jgi:hypothetical protein
MRGIIFLLLTFFIIGDGVAQNWTGNGDGTDWNDPANWQGGAVPVAGGNVLFKFNLTGSTPISVTNTGLTPSINKLTITGSSVTLNLDINIGDNTGSDHSVVVNYDDPNLAVSSLTFGSGTFNLNPPDNKNGIAIFASEGGNSIFISSTATLVLTGAGTTAGAHGINLSGDNTTFTNEGTIEVDEFTGYGIRSISTGGTLTNSGTLKLGKITSDGIYNEATFTNSGSIICPISIGGDTPLTDVINNLGTFTNSSSGSIVINSPSNDGILISGGTFENSSSGSIVINSPSNDGILISGGTFENSSSGSIVINSPSNDGILISGGTFENDGEITIDDDPTSSGENAIEISGGTFNNNDGAEITVTGYANNWALNVNGTFMNNKGAIMDINDRFRVDSNGDFINNGLIFSHDSGPGIWTSTGAQATNNAFFNYDNSNVFGGPSDNEGLAWFNNGISVQGGTATINAANSCEVNVDNADYTWSDGTNNSTTSAGALSLEPFDEANETLNVSEYTSGQVQVTVNNIECTTTAVDLIDFNVLKEENASLLRWNVVNEWQIDQYIVEKSANGNDFNAVGKVPSNKESLGFQEYEYIDYQVNKGYNYYRLRIEDENGELAFSHIAGIKFEEMPENKVVDVFPTKLRLGDALNIRMRPLAVGENVEIELYDANGRVVISQVEANNLREMKLDGITQTGIYYLRITIGNLVQHQQIAIMR